MKKGFVSWKVRSNPTLGEYLRDARTSKLIDLKAVAHKINVRESFLTFLEKGRYDRLPADIYVKGFIRSYTRFLKLDESYALNLYERERDILTNINKNVGQRIVREPFRNPILMLSPRTVTIGIVALLLFSSFLYLWFQFSSVATPPRLVLFEPGDHVITKTSSLVVSGRTEPEAKVSVNGQAIFVDDKGNFRETLSLQSGVNTFTVVARNKLGREEHVTKEVMADIPQDNSIAKIEQPASGESAASAKDQAQDQAERAVDLVLFIDNTATWVYVEVDGQTDFKGTMLPGSSKKFHGKNNVSLTSGDASNTRVVFNGMTVDRLSDEKGAIRDLEFTSDLEMKQRGRIVRKF